MYNYSTYYYDVHVCNYMSSLAHHPLVVALEALGLVLSCQPSPLEAPLPRGLGLELETETYYGQKILHKI